MSISVLIHIAYLIAAFLFLMCLKWLSSPRTARSGNMLGAIGMLIAAVVVLLDQEILTPGLILAGIIVGALIGGIMAKRVQMTAMPQMVAILNGFGGAASGLVAAGEFVRLAGIFEIPTVDNAISIALGAAIGAITFSGSVIAFAKLQGLISGRPITFGGQQAFTLILFLITLAAAVGMAVSPSYLFLILLLIVPLVLGINMVIRIGGADMPVVISLLNSFSGLAAAAAGFVVSNPILIIAGTLVGAAGYILTVIMAKAMNRSLSNIVFGAFGGEKSAGQLGAGDDRPVRSVSAEDAATVLAYAQSVIIVPGYGLAVAQAQHLVAELMKQLEARHVSVKFAIHPVAGRMPGHMNVLLAEANIPYDKLFDLEQINDEFQRTDVAVVIGANDVTNPAARDNPDSPLYGMPVLNVDQAKSVLVLKRSMGSGFAGVDNPLFYNEKTMMLFGDAKKSVQDLVNEVKNA